MSNVVDSAASKPANENLVDGRSLTNDELKLLTDMNLCFSHVVVGGKHRIMTLKPCPVDGARMTFERVNDFSNYYAHKPKVATKNQGLAWFQWGGKAFYPNGIGYYPNSLKLPKGVFNTFQGFGCKPKAGDTKLILEHIYEVLCAGDVKAAKYFIEWLAHIVQYPEIKPTVAILMKSAEGTGKGTIYKLLKKMLGANAHQVNGSNQLTGRFNGILAGRLLIFGDEVDMTDKKSFDRAKGIISEPTISLELKGIDPEPIPNMARFIFTGNHDQVIAAGTRERRFLVLETAEHMIGNREYFKSLNNQIDEGGASAFFAYLQNIDLKDFDPYKAPATKGLIAEKLVGLPPVPAYIYRELNQPRPFNGVARITAPDLISSFCSWTSENCSHKVSEPSARSQIGKFMNTLEIEAIGRSDRGNGKFYELPPLDDLKTRFAKYLDHDANDVFN
jgi:putative DNA primase/helicase